MATIKSTISIIDRFSRPLSAFKSKIEQATSAQERMDKGFRKNSSSVDSFTGSLRTAIGAYSAFTAMKNTINLSDELTLSTNRLSLMNDGLQTTKQLQREIYEAAQRSRGSYTAMLGTVSKLGILAGDAFPSNKDIVGFAETMNKAFIVGGSSSREQAMAMYQLTQALGSGRLQGDEYRSIIENAPLLADYIEDYMRNVKGATGSLKEMSAQGILTSDNIVNAVSRASDEINKKFESLPLTWGQVWETIKNRVIWATQPILKVISFLAQHWSVLRPIVIGLATAIGVLTAAKVLYNAQMAASIFLEKVSAAYTAMHTSATVAQAGAATAATSATFGYAAAQWGLNAAMLASPITWILLAIILVIAAVYAVVAAYNAWTDTSISATGIIVGCIYAVWQILINIFTFLQNLFEGLIALVDAVGTNIVIAFGNSIKTVQAFFWDLLATATRVISEIAAQLDKLPFVKFDSAGLVKSANRYANKADAIRSSKKEYLDPIEIGSKAMKTHEYGKIGDAYNRGYDVGASFADKVGDAFDWSGKDSSFDFGANDLDKVKGNGGQTAANTAKTADAVTKSSEDLKWLRIIAERKAINKFTTAQIKVDMGGVNNVVNKNMDLDGVVSYLEDKLTETMVSVAEGTHI